ncbi:MAG: hypothetical protein HKM03_00990 [Steroidobacteraceae bacterium]|nr:hypothetical protein [Steroidobacteraceae bacterium]
MVPLWALSFVLGLPVGAGWPPILWHAHEMLFGFMLTAVPNWTGEKRVTGRSLMVLALLWGAARISFGCCTWPMHGCRWDSR